MSTDQWRSKHLHCQEYAKDTKIWSTKFFGICVVAKALCEDGVLRTVRLNQSPDTFFSIPGRATFKGKTLTGYVGTKFTDDQEPYLFFKLNMKG